LLAVLLCNKHYKSYEKEEEEERKKQNKRNSTNLIIISRFSKLYQNKRFLVIDTNFFKQMTGR